MGVSLRAAEAKVHGIFASQRELFKKALGCWLVAMYWCGSTCADLSCHFG